MTKCRLHNYSHVYFIVLIILGTIFSDLLLRHSVEDSYRKQGRYNLEQVRYCYTNVVPYVGVEKALRICTAKTKTSFTGDVYVLDADTKEFIHENSSDTGEHKLTFTKESVGSYFNDWKSGEKALGTIMLGKDSEDDVNASYLFDSSIEWLEWKYMPDDVKNTNELKLIAVQGIQSDEAYAEFRLVEYSMFVFSSIGIIILLFLHRLQFNTEYTRRRRDDKSRPKPI